MKLGMQLLLQLDDKENKGERMKGTASVVHLSDYVLTVQSAKQISQGLGFGGEVAHQAPIEKLNELMQLLQHIPKYDVIGMDNLVALLRKELVNIQHRTDGIDSINKLSAKIDVSRTHLSNFRDGGSVCMHIMNRLATVFNIRYLVENYTDEEQTIS
jgi:hypothetical protein